MRLILEMLPDRKMVKWDIFCPLCVEKCCNLISIPCPGTYDLRPMICPLTEFPYAPKVEEVKKK